MRARDDEHEPVQRQERRPERPGELHVWQCTIFRALRRNAYFSWRRGWDSNPRAPCEAAGFQDRCIQPLCHLSVFFGELSCTGAADRFSSGTCNRAAVVPQAPSDSNRKAALSTRTSAT